MEESLASISVLSPVVNTPRKDRLDLVVGLIGVTMVAIKLERSEKISWSFLARWWRMDLAGKSTGGSWSIWEGSSVMTKLLILFRDTVKLKKLSFVGMRTVTRSSITVHIESVGRLSNINRAGCIVYCLSERWRRNE